MVHEIMVALLRFFRHRQVFVQIETDYIFERQAFLTVHADQFFIEFDRR